MIPLCLELKGQRYRRRDPLVYSRQSATLPKWIENVPTLSHREVSHNFPQRRRTFEQKMRDSVELPTQKQIPPLQLQRNTPG